jgi:hypothetical protein
MEYSRSACGFTPAFGRVERRFPGGFRRETEASLYLEATTTATALWPGCVLGREAGFSAALLTKA